MTEELDGQDLRVGSHHLRRAVGGAVVQEEDLVVSLEIRHNLSDLPEEQTRGVLLVISGDTDVDHSLPNSELGL